MVFARDPPLDLYSLIASDDAYEIRVVSYTGAY